MSAMQMKSQAKATGMGLCDHRSQCIPKAATNNDPCDEPIVIHRSKGKKDEGVFKKNIFHIGKPSPTSHQ
jgi:hypothetical protein